MTYEGFHRRGRRQTATTIINNTTIDSADYTLLSLLQK